MPAPFALCTGDCTQVPAESPQPLPSSHRSATSSRVVLPSPDLLTMSANGYVYEWMGSQIDLVRAHALPLVAAGLINDPGLVGRLGEVVPSSFEIAPWIAVLGATLLAFFAFIGFEDMVNMAEEVRRRKSIHHWRALRLS